MKLVIGGHSRNIGKTSVVAGIIQALPEMNWTAIKITQYGHGICSRNGRQCHCSVDEHRYAIVEEKDREGKGDTCRFLKAGAQRSFWVRTKQGQLKEAMPEIESMLQGSSNFIIESNSLLQYIRPDLYLFVMDLSQSDFKESAKKYLHRADACIIVSAHGLKPNWLDVPPNDYSGKPTFRITPPPYVNEEIVAFVRKSL
jgi:hypothetical protein